MSPDRIDIENGVARLTLAHSGRDNAFDARLIVGPTYALWKFRSRGEAREGRDAFLSRRPAAWAGRLR